MTATETLTCEEIVAELRAMIEHSRRNPGIIQRTFNTSLAVMYEFIAEDQIQPYYFTFDGKHALLEAGTLPYEECDVVIRTTPDALRQILDGTLGGREAVVSGRMDIRKAPSMPKLLMMRGMFNRYRKSLQGRTLKPDAELHPDTGPVIVVTPQSEQQ